MDKIESARGLGVVAIFFELPAFDYAAAIGEFDAIETVFYNDRALLRLALGRSGRSGGYFRAGRRLLSEIASGSRRLAGRDRRRGLRLIRLLRRHLRLGSEEFGPRDYDNHR